MKRILSLVIILGIASGLFGINASATKANAGKAVPGAWTEGHGTAGAFIGAIDNATIIVAGGSDFLDARPWEGGRKTFLNNIWILKNTKEGWSANEMQGTTLPFGISNGCSVQHRTPTITMASWWKTSKTSPVQCCNIFRTTTIAGAATEYVL